MVRVVYANMTLAFRNIRFRFSWMVRMRKLFLTVLDGSASCEINARKMYKLITFSHPSMFPFACKAEKEDDSPVFLTVVETRVVREMRHLNACVRRVCCRTCVFRGTYFFVEKKNEKYRKSEKNI